MEQSSESTQGSSTDEASQPAPRNAPNQGRLDALVTRVATMFMEASFATVQSARDRALQAMSEFFGVDTSFLRRNDFARDLSVLVAEWPRRANVPEPDPLGEVPFDADPVFHATRDLHEPYVMRPAGSPDAYQDRVAKGSGIVEVSMAMVPLLRDGHTTGVLGFVKFGDRAWDEAEVNALQAVASMMVHLHARVEAEERLIFNAYHDELTGLPNRRALLEELDRRLSSSHGATTVMFIDLDRFKTMNDLLGHDAGDMILTSVAERLRTAVDDNTFVARLSGDEFVIVSNGISDKRTAGALAERLLERVARPIDISGHELTRTISIGIATEESMRDVGEDLLRHADVALRTAKASGGNRAVFFDDRLRCLNKERSDIEILLRRAIDHGELKLHYQPELDLRSGRLLALEALVRWNHPERGLVAAGEFIGVAEDTGLIVDLGHWVLEEACRQMAEWRTQLPQHRFVIRVNMSPVQLATRNIVDLIAECLRKNRLPGQVLCLEITEHAVMQDVKQATEALHALKCLGITLAIDDFGTGFSSMTQLKRLPVDALKIDRSFVDGLAVDGGDRAIVDATVRLAKSFGLDVIAEGIETHEVLEQLVRLGCHRGQGYLLSKPRSASDLRPLLFRGGVELGSLGPMVDEGAVHTEPPPLMRSLA